MRTLVVSAFAALLFSTGLALAQGSGAAGDIGPGAARTSSGSTVGQSAADPGTTTPAPAPKAKKSTRKKKGAE